MKEAIGGSWLFTIVILMVVLFTSFISISTNYSRSYKVKDEIISAIQRNRGVNEQSLTEINDYLAQVGYRTIGDCPQDGEEWLGFYYTDSRSDHGSRKVNYCIKRHSINYRSMKSDGEGNMRCVSNGAPGHFDSAYYSVMTFFKLDMPVISQFFKLRVEGQTSIVYRNEDISRFYVIEGITKCDTSSI